jgi:DNA-binding response OmpR family regulator
MARIVCVEDDADIQNVLRVVLGREHEVRFFNGLQPFEIWLSDLAPGSAEWPNLILLDISLPDGSGLDLFARVNEKLDRSNVGVILLTGTNSSVARIRGFTLGAMDYIAKPFDPMELLVRVKQKLKFTELAAQSRRVETVSNSASAPVSLRTHRLVIDLGRQMVVDEGAPDRPELLKLTPVEFRLLVLFIKQRQSGREMPLAREAIAQSIYAEEIHSGQSLEKILESRAIDHHVSTLRKKLALCDHRLESVYGVGYRLVWPSAQSQVA